MPDITQMGTAFAAVLGGIAAIIVAIKGKAHAIEKTAPDPHATVVDALERALAVIVAQEAEAEAEAKAARVEAQNEREARLELQRQLDVTRERYRDSEIGRVIQQSIIEKSINPPKDPKETT